MKVKNNTLIYLKIFEINELMNKNLWFNYFYKLELHRLLKRKDNWIDFEKEITNVVQTLDKTIRLYNQRELNDFSDESMQKYFNKLQYLLKQNQEILSITKNESNIDDLESLKQNLLKDLNRLSDVWKFILLIILMITVCIM